MVAHRATDAPAVPLAVEEGEILDSLIGAPPVRDVAWEAEQRVFAGLNLAALEALSGRGDAALAACKRAVAAAEGVFCLCGSPTNLNAEAHRCPINCVWHLLC